MSNATDAPTVRLAAAFARHESPPDPLWERIRREATEASRAEPFLVKLFRETIEAQPDLENAVFHRVAARLQNDILPAARIVDGFRQAASADPQIPAAMRADIAAVLDRDPACHRAIEPLLYFKGFHAIQTHRLSHWLWTSGRRDFALYLQSRSSEVFQTDIHPGARIGSSVFLDHATGLVVGETAVIGDDVSILHAVTLGGSGKEGGDRHPKIGSGVMIGAGAKILGNIAVGKNARVAAGSVVLRPVPPHTTVAGVPAKTTRSQTPAHPSETMEQALNDLDPTYFNPSI
jgi:serine O-acetyltransferase